MDCGAPLTSLWLILHAFGGDGQEDLCHDMIGVMKIKSWPY
jgi:hypothetical protein